MEAAGSFETLASTKLRGIQSRKFVILIYELDFRQHRKISKSVYQLRHVCLSVCPSALKHSDFLLNLYLNIFQRSIQKIQI